MYVSLSPGAGLDFKPGFVKALIRDCADLEIIHMHIRYCIKINLPVNSGEAIEILILAPAAGCPLEHLSCQLIFPFFHIIGEFKF